MKRTIFSLLTASLLALAACETSKDPSTSLLYLPITPPFKGLKENNLHTISLNAKEGKTVQLPSGSSLVVAPNSFVDKEGKRVEGTVDLSYQEFRSAADIVASGIPMDFQDEKGEIQHMQSAGMFELKGTANGKEVFIAEDKPVQVNMASHVKGDYDFFYLEETKKEEATAGLFPRAYAQSPNDKKNFRWRKLPLPEKKPTDRPEKSAFPTQPFDLTFNTKTNPETRFLDSIQWLYSDDKASSNPLAKENAWVLKEAWKEVHVGHPLYRSEEVYSIEKRWVFPYSYKDKDVEIVAGETNPRYKTKEGNLLTYDYKDYIVYAIYNEDNAFYNSISFVNLLTGEKREVTLERSTNMKNQFTNAKSNYEETHFLTRSKNNIQVWDKSGQLLQSITAPLDLKNMDFLRYKNRFVLLTLEGNHFMLWDWVGNKVGYSPRADLVLLDNHSYNYRYSSSPAILLEDKNKTIYLYDWNVQTLATLTGARENDDVYFPHSIPIVISNRTKKKDGILVRSELDRIWDMKGKILFQAPINASYRFSKSLTVSQEATFIVQDSAHCYLFHIDGRYKDLKKEDPNMLYLFDMGPDLLSLSVGNSILKWDTKTGKIKRKITPECSSAFYISNKNGIINGFDFNKNVVCYDSNGRLLAEYNKSESLWNEVNSSLINDWANKGNLNDSLGWKIDTTYKLPSSIYRLSLYNDTSEFHTYIQYDEATWRKIEAYKTALRAKNAKNQAQAQQEETVLRTFEVNKFGIYNWDIFYDKSEVITLNADFVLESDSIALDSLNSTLFLITGINGNAVIKNPRSRWHQFQFDPKDPNTLLMVLPNNRIALLKADEFAKLDLEEIKKTGKHTFRLNVLDAVQSKEELEKILKTPPL